MICSAGGEQREHDNSYPEHRQYSRPEPFWQHAAMGADQPNYQHKPRDAEHDQRDQGNEQDAPPHWFA